MIRFLMSLLYVEVTISIEVWRFSRCIAMKLLQANAANKIAHESLQQFTSYSSFDIITNFQAKVV